MKSKPVSKKRVNIKAWAVVERDGDFRKLFFTKSKAELNVSSYAGERLVTCKITYSV